MVMHVLGREDIVCPEPTAKPFVKNLRKKLMWVLVMDNKEYFAQKIEFNDYAARSGETPKDVLHRFRCDLERKYSFQDKETSLRVWNTALFEAEFEEYDCASKFALREILNQYDWIAKDVKDENTLRNHQ